MRPGALIVFALLFVMPGARGTGGLKSLQSRGVSRAVTVDRILLDVPDYTVFDWIRGTTQGQDVILTGEVTTPTLKRQAEITVKRVQGVKNITDNIRILPGSNGDDRLRQAVFDSYASDPTLRVHTSRLQSRIHIIVEGSRVTLKGSVPSAREKILAGIRAQAVPGVRSVDNQLRAED